MNGQVYSNNTDPLEDVKRKKTLDKNCDARLNVSMMNTDIRLISIPEACKRLGIGHWHIYQQINKRALKTVKIGKRRLVSTRALSEYISSLEQ